MYVGKLKGVYLITVLFFFFFSNILFRILLNSLFWPVFYRLSGIILRC